VIRTVSSFSHPSVSYLALLCTLCFISGCDAVHGGGSPAAQPSSIAITPATAQIRAGDTQVFVMTDRRSRSGVTWLVNGIPGGNATLGTIDSKGLYTAPPAPPSPNLVRVMAIRTASPSMSKSAAVTLYNPIPILTSVSPQVVPVGAFTLTIKGNKFVRGAQVHFAGIALQTTLVSPSQLTATGIATQPGNAQVSLSNPDPGSASSGATASVKVTSPAQAPTPDVSQADVIVDGSKTLSETGFDDLSAAKNIYSSASAPESDGGLSTDWSLISAQFPMRRMRNINGLGDCGLDVSGNLTGCSRLKNDLQNIQSKNLTPHIVVGQWAPSSIGGSPLQWGASQWAQYDALCYSIINYVVTQYGGSGFNDTLFEVANELDTTQNPQDLWLTPTSHVPQGDPSRFAQFDTVYAHWAHAVSLVAQRNPGKKVRIAAPATGFWTAYYGSGQLWQNQVIKKYAALGIRLDVVSLHIYGGEVNDLAKYAQSIRKTLIESGNPKAEIWVTEWGASDLGDSYFGAINGSHEGAAWAISFLLQALKGTVTGGAFLEVRDNQGHDTAGTNSNMHGASWNHVEDSVEYPKAISNAFTMVDRLKGTRKLATTAAAKPNLLGLASSDSHSASLVVANYNYDFDYAHKTFSDRTSSEAVTVAFQNLPFSGPVTVERYLIDAQTSNLDHWIAEGKTPPSVQATQLQRVETFTMTSTNGALILPARQLGQSAVSLWIVHQ
jgi:hypothetical protein